MILHQNETFTLQLRLFFSFITDQSRILDQDSSELQNLMDIFKVYKYKPKFLVYPYY
jgi:hypothetical protein